MARKKKPTEPPEQGLQTTSQSVLPALPGEDCAPIPAFPEDVAPATQRCLVGLGEALALDGFDRDATRTFISMHLARMVFAPIKNKEDRENRKAQIKGLAELAKVAIPANWQKSGDDQDERMEVLLRRAREAKQLVHEAHQESRTADFAGEPAPRLPRRPS
jgi:hypothetical protein